MMRYHSLCPLGIFILLLLSGGACLRVQAQHQYDIWYFGNGAGLDFRNGAPAPLTNGQSNTLEGSAVQCGREDGRLQFYTDGVTVWNALHQRMPNGTGLKGHWTSAQSALIVPNPGDTNLFYIFTAGAGSYAANPNNGVRYSVVDMRLNGGLGDVTVKNIDLIPEGRASEMLNATRHCNGRDYWVATHELGTNRFLFLLVTPQGITDTVVNPIGRVLSGDIGTQSMGQFSPNGRMFAVATPGEQILELYDFDNSSGTLSNYRLIASDWYYYSPAFSPDNSKLYVSSLASNALPNYLYQFDLAAGDLTAIQASRNRLHTEVGNWDGAQLQLGPDGRIYVSYINRNMLGIIQQPNQSAPACDYQHDGISLAGKTTSYGLPNCISSDMPNIVDGIVNVDLSVSVSNGQPQQGEVVTYSLIVCNSSSVEAKNVAVSFALPSEITYISGMNNYPNHIIPSLAAGECDTIVIEALAAALGDPATGLSACADITGVDGRTNCIAPDARCVTIKPVHIPDEVDYTYYLAPQCPGVTDLTEVLFNSRRYTDTITSVFFDGLDGRNFSYAGTTPVRYVIHPTSDQRIPILVRHVRQGTMTVVMRLITSSGDTFRIRLITVTKAAITPFLDLAEIRLGSRSGTIDTCVTVTNITNRSAVVVDSTWIRGGNGFVEMTGPPLPFTLRPGATVELCFRITDPQNGLDDTLVLGGAEAVSFCPHCVVNWIAFNDRSPSPIISLSVEEAEELRRTSGFLVYPNPARNSCSVEFRLVSSGDVNITLVDAAGRQVLTLANSWFAGGFHTLPVNTGRLPAGTYYVQFEYDGAKLLSPLQVLH